MFLENQRRRDLDTIVRVDSERWVNGVQLGRSVRSEESHDDNKVCVLKCWSWV